jgi:hypothetical protein
MSVASMAAGDDDKKMKKVEKVADACEKVFHADRCQQAIEIGKCMELKAKEEGLDKMM